MDIRNVAATAAPRTVDSDPRNRLSREKFFTMRPRPLERWLWKQRVPAAAERIFWFHWSHGAQSGDWCSQFALHFVAQECEVDASTVTRAYQALKRLGLIRRTDPGRDAANPFAQATFVTEVLVPTDLLAKLPSIPNRRPRLQPATATPAPAPVASTPEARPADPHQHLSLKARRERMKAMSAALSDAERERWHRAVCSSAQRVEFDPDSQIPADTQAEMQQYLAAREMPKAAPERISATPSATVGTRRLSVFEVARLRREVQRVAGTQQGDELSRQVLWAIEASTGSLRQFAPLHALNISLKKLREGQWTRPNRMPPNWVRQVRESATPETCRGA